VTDPAVPVMRTVWRGNASVEGPRLVAEESAVAFTYNRVTHAVMLATPWDLEDFAYGFSLSEGIIDNAGDVTALDIVQAPDGIELRMDLASDRLDALTQRQRRMAGPSGCGLCGLDSLAAAIRPVPIVPTGLELTSEMTQAAMQAMAPAQTLNAATRAVHAAAFWTPARGMVALREDVGRHNALDKLAGALARSGVAAHEGAVLLSSRISVEMVQKAATLGASVVVAVSAPTALAIRTADAAGMTLIGIARPDGFEVFTHPQRIVPREAINRVERHVA
jgi:FdhD protein